MGSVTCERVKIDRMGYTSFGRYFGPVNTRDPHNLATAPVFLCADEDSGVSEYVRAFDAADAKRRFSHVLTRTSMQPSLWQHSTPVRVSLRRRFASWPHFVEALDEYADIVIPDNVPVVYVATASIPLPPPRTQSAAAMKREEAHAGKMVHALLRGDDMPPVLLNEDGTIHDGRARLVAALRTGLPHVPVVYIGPFRTATRNAEQEPWYARHANPAPKARKDVEAAVVAAQLYIGSDGHVGVKDQQRLYNRMVKQFEKVAAATGNSMEDVAEQISAEARRRGRILPRLAKDY